MRIDVEKLAAHGFKLDLTHLGPRRLVELGPSGALSGYFESTEDELRIRAGASPALSATNLDWELADLRIELTSQAQLESVQVALAIARDGSGWGGSIGLRRGNAAALELHLKSFVEPVALGGIELEGVELEREGGRLSLKLARASIARATMNLGKVRVIANRIELTEGVSFDGSTLRLPSLTVGELRFGIDDVAALFGRSKPSSPAKAPLDLTILDQLNGRLDLDLMADATVPLIGRRRATHHFRIPIAEGSIDFKGVERNLSLLEDAVLDFAVRDGKLCFERDLPLLPFNQKTLVYWELAPEELLMAKRNRVRLRRLREFRVIDPKKVEPDRKSSVELRSLHFDNVTIDLTLRGPAALPVLGGRVVLGQDGADGIGSLRVRGDVRYDVEGAADRTSLRLDAERITGALEKILVGAFKLQVQSLVLAAIEGVTLAFEGVRPRALEGSIAGIDVRELRASR
ncbi:MAG TPA: hypothetical protein VFB62_02255 [Polyangiaceae bacterium]|jgi:hypothetical protein|nr:hypothetical protein [Polyangiaceae bacterium]